MTAIADPAIIAKLHDARSLALIRLQAVQREQQRLEGEHDALVAKVAVLDARIEQIEVAIANPDVIERELARARRMLRSDGS